MRLDLGLLGLVVEAVEHVAQLDLAAAQLLPEREQIAGAERRPDGGVEHLLLAALDALRERDLALAGEQRHLPHLAQVRAHRVVRARLLAVVVRARGLRDPVHAVRRVHHRDLGLAEDRHHLVELLAAEQIGERVVHVFVGEEALAAAARHEVLHVAELARLGANVGRLPRGPLRGGREARVRGGRGVCLGGSASGGARSHRGVSFGQARVLQGLENGVRRI